MSCKISSIQDLLKQNDLESKKNDVPLNRLHEYETAPPPLAKVDFIQSFIPSSEYIKSISVMEIKTVEDLESLKLGVNDMEEACHTCDNFLYQCPGHSAHLPLTVPVYMIFFVRKLVKILNCFCFYCQKLRLPKDHPKYQTIHDLPRSERLDALFDAGKSIKRCGEEYDKDEVKQVRKKSKGTVRHTILDVLERCDQGCGKLFLTFEQEDRECAFIRAIVPLEPSDHLKYKKDKSWRPFRFGPSELYECLQVLDHEVLHMLGCNQDNHPGSMMWSNFLVPSLNTRPCHMFRNVGANKKRSYNGWNKYLKTIFQESEKLKDLFLKSDDDISICVYSFNHVVSRDFQNCFQYGYLDKKKRDAATKRLKKEEKKNANAGPVEMQWRELNKQIAAFHSFKHKKYAQKSSGYGGKPKGNVEERYRGQKAGRWRGNIIARRCNFVMRFVLDGDIDIDPDEVGVPISEAMNLTKKIYVNALNIDLVQQWILNGPLKYPGANYVGMKDGEEIDLNTFENRRDIDLSKVLFVRRHLHDGDVALANRQPTLHRLSFISLRIKVTHTFAGFMHPCVFHPLGADCDGDEINLYIPQDIEAVAELMYVIPMKDGIMKDGKAWIKFIQNAVNGSYILTDDDTLLTRDQAWQMLMCLKNPGPIECTRKDGLYTGKQVFSALLPEDLTIRHKNFVIEKGQLLSGQIGESQLNSTTGILSSIYRNYPHDRAVQFLSEGYRMFQMHLDRFGHSAGYYDSCVDFHHRDAYEQYQLACVEKKECIKINDFQEQLYMLMDRFQQVKKNVKLLSEYADQFSNHVPGKGSEAVEQNIQHHLQKLISMSSTAQMSYHKLLHRKNKENGLIISISSGASGNKNMLNQMSGMLGQIFVMYRRFPLVSSHFRKGHKTIYAHGFSDRPYSESISLTGLISEAHSTCESGVNKNKGTANSGYTVRKLTTCMMGIVVDHFGRVVDTRDQILWQKYGNDGYDSKLLLSVPIRLVKYEEWDIIRKYGLFFDLKTIVQMSSSYGKHHWIALMKHTKSKIDRNWFNHLVQFNHKGVFVTDQTEDLMEHMTLATKQDWIQVKHSENVVNMLMEDTHQLFLLHQHMMQILRRSHHNSTSVTCRSPIDFKQLFYSCQQEIGPSEKVNLHPFHYLQFRNHLWKRLEQDNLVCDTNIALKCLFFDWLSTRSLVLQWHFGLDHMVWLAKKIKWYCYRSRIQPGESVGTNSTQSLGEVFTQLSLKTPHLSGHFPTMIAGSARIEALVNANFSNAMMKVVLSKTIKTENEANMFAVSLVCTYMKDLVRAYPTYTWGKNYCLFTVPLDRRKCIGRMVSVRKIALRLGRNMGLRMSYFQVPFMDTPGDWDIVFKVPFNDELWTDMMDTLKSNIQDRQVIADSLAYNVMYSIVVNGIPAISNFILERTEIRTSSGLSKRWLVVTLGSSLARILSMPQVDAQRTTSNDVKEMCDVLGIHAARKALEQEFLSIMSGMADTRHVKMIARFMTSKLMVKGMKVSGMGQHIPPLQRAAYERGFDQMTDLCSKADKDDCRTVCGAALSNKLMHVGTGYGIDLKKVPLDETLPVVVREQLRKQSTQICQFIFTPKADGERMFLTLTTSLKGKKIIAFVNRENAIFTFNPDPQNYGLPDSFFHGTVLDGELVKLKNSEDRCFIIFECLMCCGNQTSILRYDQRIEIGRRVIREAHPKDVPIVPVDQGQYLPYVIKSLFPETYSGLHQFGKGLPFYTLSKPLIRRQGLIHYEQTVMSRLPYHEDGFIMPHLADPALPFRMNFNGVMKYKPRKGDVSENTIDFRISFDEKDTPSNIHDIFFQRTKTNRKIPPNKMVWSYPVSIRDVEHFRRSKEGDVSLWIVAPNHSPFCFARAINTLGQGVQDGDVVECQWNYKKHSWTVTRLRKKNPNEWNTVMFTLLNIKEDIKLSEFVP